MIDFKILEALTGGIPLATIALRVLVAVAAGAIVGWERERLEKPAGLRTHILVALGSASFVLVGLEAPILLGQPDLVVDPTRVIQGIAGGLGFLGAGTIIKQSVEKVSGLTTAATIWVAGALGAAAGMGSYGLVILVAVLTTLALILGRFEH